MNYTKALMGIILCANMSTFTMNLDDNNSTNNSQPSIPQFKLTCGICGQKMENKYETRKTVFHSACMMEYAHDEYVVQNPIITSEPWKTPQSSTAAAGKNWKNKKNRWRKK